MSHIFKLNETESNIQARILWSESGKFIIDRNGQLINFEPDPAIFVEEKTHLSGNYEYSTLYTIHNLIIPEGVKSFASDSFRSYKVTGSLILPQSLESIGTESIAFGDSGQVCVFANCILSKVTIPNNVKELGNFAFGHTYIEELVLPDSIRSTYLRQFKDGHVKRLVMPEIYREIPKGEEFGWLVWCSTQVDEIIYYKS